MRSYVSFFSLDGVSVPRPIGGDSECLHVEVAKVDLDLARAVCLASASVAAQKGPDHKVVVAVARRRA
jgi:hypothetical protein